MNPSHSFFLLFEYFHPLHISTTRFTTTKSSLQPALFIQSLNVKTHILLRIRRIHILTAKMAPHYLVHDEPHDEFIDFVRRELQPGIDGDDNPVKFICPKKTKAWWKKRSEHRIVRALNHNINVRPATIENGYLNIFSILVFMSKTYLITQFTSNNFRDDQLPLLNHEYFGKGSAIERDMKDFCETQWMFCPVMFSSETPMDMRKIPRDQILPIQEQSRKTATGNNPKSTIRIVTLYSECHDHDWSSSVSLPRLLCILAH